MSIQLTDEQLMIQSMVRDFAREVIAPTASERDKNKAFPAENLKRLAELGFMGMMVPPQYNGSGADTVSYVLALSEIAYACASTAVAMSVTNMVADAIEIHRETGGDIADLLDGIAATVRERERVRERIRIRERMRARTRTRARIRVRTPEVGSDSRDGRPYRDRQSRIRRGGPRAVPRRRRGDV